MASSTIKNELNNLVMVGVYSYEYSGLASGSALSITANDFGFSTPDGYVPLGVRRMTTGSSNCVITGFLADNTNAVLTIRNVGTGTASGTATMRVLYIRSSAFGVIS